MSSAHVTDEDAAGLASLAPGLSARDAATLTSLLAPSASARPASARALLAALLTAAVVGLIGALDDPSRGLASAAVAMGLGSWVKGPVAIVLPAETGEPKADDSTPDA